MDTIEQWYQRGQVEAFLGQPIFHIEEGDTTQQTVLLIHGFPTSSWDWAPIWSTLRENHRLIALDMLGFGYSAKPSAHTYSIHEQADIIEAMIREKALTEFHVLAHDYGDTVAQELLARQNAGSGAGQWQSVCFLNGGLFPETHKALLIQKLLLSPLGPLVNKLTSKAPFDKSFSRVFGPDTQPSAQELESFWRLITHNDGKHIFHNLITYMTDRKQHRARWLSALQEARIPIALINGSLDPVSGVHMVARYREIVGEPQYIAALDTIGHYPQVEAPEQVSQHYLDFIRTAAI
ncbi:alpha/beta fold hydrolase [Parvularcula sp. IMCC14364]|uniref:alpha/beta fold hydrolase n=1 Tax=Parvularcula sp. IMCC14364 TaxID=3067902 RepID=UPI0027413FB2|nr:alpha/beta hydrolase [Parvularcula sp. IMCC14364]